MNAPPKKGRDHHIAPLLTKLNSAREYNTAQRLQDSLARRLNRVASVTELMPRVLAVTFARGTRYRANADHKRIAQRAATAKP